MSSPSEIWLEPVDHETDPDMGRSWCVHPLDCDECGAESVRYVRADIAEARVKELEAINLGLTKTLVESNSEITALHNTIIRQGELLTGVVNAIRGEPPHDTAWSHHDAPQLAERMKAENAELRKFIEAKMHHLPIEDQHAAAAILEHCGRHEPRKERCLT